MAATSPHVQDLARLLPAAGQRRSMGPMANPHNLAPPGTVFVLGTAQAYGDRGSNMPHLKLRLYKHLATKIISGDLASPDAKSQNPIFGWSELFVVNFSVDKPIHQSIGNFTAHLLVYGFVEWKFL